MKNLTMNVLQGAWMTAVFAILLIVLGPLNMDSLPAAAPNGPTALHLTRVIPAASSVYLPCAADGAGERMEFSGTFKAFIDGTRAPDGSVTFSIRGLPNDVTGEGQATGTVYHAASADSPTAAYHLGRAETIPISHEYHLAAPGSGSRAIIMAVRYTVVNDGGGVRFENEAVSFRCR